MNEKKRETEKPVEEFENVEFEFVDNVIDDVPLPIVVVETDGVVVDDWFEVVAVPFGDEEDIAVIEPMLIERWKFTN